MFFFFSTTELGNRKKEKINVPTTGKTLTKSSSTCGLCSSFRYSITVTSCATISLTREGSTVKFTAWGTEHRIFYGLQSCSCNSADTHTHTHPHPHPTHTHTTTTTTNILQTFANFPHYSWPVAAIFCTAQYFAVEFIIVVHCQRCNSWVKI